MEVLVQFHRVFNECPFLNKLDNSGVGIPEPRPLQGWVKPVSLVILADDAFEICMVAKEYLITACHEHVK